MTSYQNLSGKFAYRSHRCSIHGIKGTYTTWTHC